MPSRKFDHILVYDVKRFGRVDNDEAGYFRYLLRQNGVEIVYTSEPLSGTDSDDLLLPMLQWNARRESKDLSKVTIRGQVSTAQDGWWMGGVPPYGYDLMYYDSEGQPLMRVHYHHSGNKHLCKPNGDLERIIPGGDKIITSKRRLVLCAIDTSVWGLFLVTGLDKVFEFTDNVANALASIQLSPDES